MSASICLQEYAQELENEERVGSLEDVREKSVHDKASLPSSCPPICAAAITVDC